MAKTFLQLETYPDGLTFVTGATQRHQLLDTTQWTTWQTEETTLSLPFMGSTTRYYHSQFLLKGILPQKDFHHPNLIFWIVIGCSKALFGQKGQKRPKIENFGLKVCSLGPQGDPPIRARGKPRQELEATRTELEATHNNSLFPIIAGCLGLRTGCLNFRCFFGPSNRNELHHSLLLSKIWGLGNRKKLW